MSRQEGCYFYLHVPKTAGTSFRNMLWQMFPAGEDEEAARERLREDVQLDAELYACGRQLHEEMAARVENGPNPSGLTGALASRVRTLFRPRGVT